MDGLSMEVMKREGEKLYASMEGSVFIESDAAKMAASQSFHSSSKKMAVSSTSVYSSSSSTMTKSSQFTQSSASLTSSLSQSTSSISESSSAMSQSSASLLSSSSQTQAIEQKAVVTQSITESSPTVRVKEMTTVERSPVTVTRTSGPVTVKETVHMSILESVYSTSKSHSFHAETVVHPPVLLGSTEAEISADEVIVVRQFALAPSPIKEILLFTSVTVDPPVEAVLAVNRKEVHLTSASLITIEKGELKLVREEIEEDEGMFEEYWEEVRTQQYEEEIIKKQYRMMQEQQRIEETRRTQEKRIQLRKRIEESKGMYSFGGRRSYAASLSSVDSPYSYRTVESPYSFE